MIKLPLFTLCCSSLFTKNCVESAVWCFMRYQAMAGVRVCQALVCALLAAAASSVQGHPHQLLAVVFGPDEPWLEADAAVELHSDNTVLMEPTPHPPSPDDAAKMARFIVHYSSWGSLSHISRQTPVVGFPLSRVYSISDGPASHSSGVPYFYMTPNDPELKDMFRDPRVSLALTLAQTPFCRVKHFDPEDPRCAQVVLTGRFVILKNTTSDWQVAQKAMFSRHPVMKNWPENHHWVFCKLEIKRILVADNFGGNKYPSVEEYFKARPDTCSVDNPLLDFAFY